MNKRRLVFAWVCTALMVGNVFAQEQAYQAKYELIRETINFLATDKAVSQDTNFRISCETLDYSCFTQQLSSKPITGIERWYNSWRSMTATDEAGLVALRNQIFADIFERPGKGYRKQLAGYEAYVSQVEYLIDHQGDETLLAEADLDTASEPFRDDAEIPPTYPEQFTDQNDNTEKDDTMIAYLALAIGIIALVLALSIFRKQAQPSADLQGLQERLDELALQMKRLEQKVADNQIRDEAIANLTDIMESVEKRVVALEDHSKSNLD